MNYIRQINLFYAYMQNKPLTASAQALYFRLLHHLNLASWRSPIAVSELTLRGELQLNHRAFLKARDELKNLNYITHIPQLGRKPALYIIKDLEEEG